MHNTPDYRGVFLRGVGGNAADLGELQGDAIRNITGSFNTSIHSSTDLDFTGPFYLGKAIGAGDDGIQYNYETFKFMFDVSRIVPIANENRPINKAVRYFIKAK